MSHDIEITHFCRKRRFLKVSQPFFFLVKINEFELIFDRLILGGAILEEESMRLVISLTLQPQCSLRAVCMGGIALKHEAVISLEHKGQGSLESKPALSPSCLV